MRRLNGYILREIGTPSLLAFFVIAFLGVASELRERYEKLPLAYIDLSDLARLTLYFMPTLVSYIVPITFMMGILLAFVRFSQHNEITAMQAAGVPLKRVVLPVILVGVVLSALSFVVQDRVQPWALNRANVFIYRELPARITLDMLPAGVMHSYRDLKVYFREKDPETKTLKDIHIRERGEHGESLSLYAESARLITDPDGTMKIFMPSVRVIPGGVEDTIVSPKGAQMEYTLPGPANEKIPSKRREKSLAGLLEEESKWAREHRDTGSQASKHELRKTRIEIKDRVAWPLACLAFSLVAAPLAVRGRRGGKSYGFAIGFGMVLVYFLLGQVLEPRGLRSLEVAVARGLVPNAVFCLVGAWALWRVDRV
ncbi:MAG TPA: YjgP/YjgQ family permease [Candidatus Hydrogenedentes bacterium]|nr:YjgP/YjgQ family permease [Candidatus Hydrogenedentota bacterium]HIJ74189.1 YjgP/YjgQ family permease [Candidatus Hydrogenedentota bacterium]